MKVSKVPCKCVCDCEPTTTITLTPEEVHDLKVIVSAVRNHPGTPSHADGVLRYSTMGRTPSGCRTFAIYKLLGALEAL